MQLSEDLSLVSDRLNGRSLFNDLSGQKHRLSTFLSSRVLPADLSVLPPAHTRRELTFYFSQPPALFPPAHPPPKSPFLSRLPRELIRREQPPQALTAFPAALSPA
jgi:hypothetical protein